MSTKQTSLALRNGAGLKGGRRGAARLSDEELAGLDHSDSNDRAILAQELQRTRAALAWSEARYCVLAERAPVMMHSIGRTGRIVSVSDLWLATLGYRREEVIGRLSADFLTDASRQYAQDVVLPEFMRTGACRDIPYEFVKRDGGIIDVLLSATAERDRRGVIQRSIAVLTNVSDHRHAEAQLRFSEARLRALADNTPLVIFMKDIEGRFVVVNREFERILGWSEADVRGKTAYELMPKEQADNHAGTDLKVIESGQPIRFEFTSGDRDDPQIWSGLKFPITNSVGATVGVGGVERNITKEKRAEVSLRRAKEQAEIASRTKSEFLANMSHELRTPLNAIIGFSELMCGQVLGPLSERYRGYAQDILQSGTLLLSLINDILDLSKIEAKRYELHEEPAGVAELIGTVLRMTRDRAAVNGIEIDETVAEDLPRMLVDERLVTQILLNLLSNAIKFTPAGGQIAISAGLVEGGDLSIIVQDTGIGIAPKDLSKAMEAFGQVENALSRKHGGTGLGLPLAKGLVELHGGRLDIDSAVNEGTKATVLLPAHRLLVH